MAETVISLKRIESTEYETIVDDREPFSKKAKTEELAVCPSKQPGSSKGCNTKFVPAYQASAIGNSDSTHRPSGRAQGLHSAQVGALNGKDNQRATTDAGKRKHQKAIKKKFQYGNYSQYYGYRYSGVDDDPRLEVLQCEWFRRKRVLDVGCNSGHVTLYIAKHWGPDRIVGMDIDGGLIFAARQNIKNYLSDPSSSNSKTGRKDSLLDIKDQPARGRVVDDDVSVQSQDNRLAVQQETLSNPSAFNKPFPLSHVPPASTQLSGNFPGNVCFVKGNYVVDNDLLLLTQREEYDVILCLSVTKWVHLNWGDAGLKRLFRRVYKHLLPGGLFILEPQPWSSYGRRKKLTETIADHYRQIMLKPDQFAAYLTSEVGFTSFELIGTPKGSSKGFERPIYLFHKDHPSSIPVSTS